MTFISTLMESVRRSFGISSAASILIGRSGKGGAAVAKLVLNVVAAIIEHRGAVLACRRRPEKSAGGKWEFPGGKVEPGESPEQALAREITEELGVTIDVGSVFSTDDTAVAGQVIRLTCFSATLSGARPVASSDHDELRWLPSDCLDQLEWALPDLPAVARLTRRVNHGEG